MYNNAYYILKLKKNNINNYHLPALLAKLGSVRYAFGLQGTVPDHSLFSNILH